MKYVDLLTTTADTKDNTVTFTSADEVNPSAWKDVEALASKEKNSSLFKKISTMFSNVRYLYKILGSTDISALGSVTQAIATLNGNVGSMKGISSSAAITTQGQYALDAREKNASVEGTLANQINILNSNFAMRAYQVNNLFIYELGKLVAITFCSASFTVYANQFTTILELENEPIFDTGAPFSWAENGGTVKNGFLKVTTDKKFQIWSDSENITYAYGVIVFMIK